MPPRAAPAIVVVGDDFGLSPRVNDGIVAALEGGLITVASLMANMPDVEAAIQSARDRGMVDRLGIHLNLTEGVALSPEIRECPRFSDASGRLIWRHAGIWTLSGIERRGIAAEWRAQIAKVIAAGVKPWHLDSHHHVHTAWPLGRIAMDIAREFAIPNVRLSRNCGPNPGLPIGVYKRVYNARISRAGLSLMGYFGSAHDVLAIVASSEKPIEVMTHPQVDESGRLLYDKTGELLEPVIAALGASGRTVSFRELVAIDVG